MKNSPILRPIFFVAIVWLCFIIRGFFYCSFLPLWEGYDESTHFAYIERLVTGNRLLVDRSEPVSHRMQVSMQLAPMPWGTAKPAISYDEYWQLPSAERASRAQQLRTLPLAWSQQLEPAGPPIYEALQPPLYYWLASVIYRLAPNPSLLDQVQWVRYCGILITSLAIPLIFLVARRVLQNSAMAVCVAALVAVLPGLMVDVARAGNECLGIFFYSWLTLACLDFAEEIIPKRTGVWIGTALGLGLITKAYFLTAIPAVGLVFAWRFLRARLTVERRQIIWQALWAVIAAMLISAWWYIRNRIYTGTWSGLLESVKLQHHTTGQFLEGIRSIDWRGAIDSVLLSHVWFGGTSSLQVRSWMYHLLFLIILGGVAGTLVSFARPKRRGHVYPVVILYIFFWIGQLYNVLLVFLTKGASTSMGWYMYCVIAAEITLLVLGLQSLIPRSFRLWAIAVLVMLLAALDLYTVHFVSIPYYTGLTVHRAGGGAVAAFHLSQLNSVGIGELLNRICSLKPSWLQPDGLAFAWACYLAATLLLIGLAFWQARSGLVTNDEPR